MQAFLNQLHIRMGEVIFRPHHVLAKAWREGRPAQARYRGAAMILVLATAGFGVFLQWSFSDTATFSLESEPSFALWFGSWFLVVWMLFFIYVASIAISIEVISWVRR